MMSSAQLKDEDIYKQDTDFEDDRSTIFAGDCGEDPPWSRSTVSSDLAIDDTTSCDDAAGEASRPDPLPLCSSSIVSPTKSEDAEDWERRGERKAAQSHPPRVVSSSAVTATPTSTEEIKTTNGDRIAHQKQKRKRGSNIETVFLECGSCLALKRRDKFSTKQWHRGSDEGRRAYCRRCELKSTIRRQVGPALEGSVVRMHAKSNRKSSSAKFLCAAIPTDAGRSADLPSELTLDGYTRERWSREDGGLDVPWRTVALRVLAGREKLGGFVDFLATRKKSAYGTFALRDGTDGFFFVPHYQPPREKGSGTRIACKYILGLGLNGAGGRCRSGPTREGGGASGWGARVKEEEEDYISPSLLGWLILARRETDRMLSTVPRGSVRAAPGLSSRPKRPRNMGYSRDWYGPRNVIGEDNDSDGEE